MDTSFYTDTARQWFNNCLPHKDIREGNLDESAFAANLNEVALGMATEEYANPDVFFRKTYITAGLNDMLGRVVRALNGESSGNRIISLQTGFGGGKTHSLIALYHRAREIAARVAVFTDNTCDVVQGRTTADGITIHTLWGELAYQLGGVAAYNRIRQNDEQLTAPTSSLMKPILEAAGSSLILIDELATYCHKANGIRVGESTLGGQTNSFIQTLTETVAQVPSCVLIVTLPASALEVSSTEEGQRVLSALKNRLDRYATSVKPVDDDEVFEVVRRRLFERIVDKQTIDDVAFNYKQMIHNRRTDLPPQSDSAEYVNKIKQSYPFHPELIDMFRLRWGSFSHFQRTRGVLRLLAAIVQDLWQRRESLEGSQMLIHTGDVRLGNIHTLTDMVTHLMGTPWETVMSADVYGTSSNARHIDDSYTTGNIMKFSLTQGVATTLLMASVESRATNAGLTMAQLKLCMLRPKAFNHSDIDTALNRLLECAHFLHTSNVGERSYHFEAKANVNILLVQAKGEIRQEAIDAEIVKRLRNVTSTVGSPMRVLAVPTGDIPEQRSLSLVILPPTLTAEPNKLLSSTEEEIKSIATMRGNSQRIYRNTILFLICSEVGRADLNSAIGDYLATKRVIEEYNSRLDNEQRHDLQVKQQDYDGMVDKAIAKAYCIIAKYSAKGGIATMVVGTDHANNLSAQITQGLTTNLKEGEWLLDSIGQTLLRENNLLPSRDKAVKVKDIYEAFLRFDDKPIITGMEAVVKTVNRYCNEGLFNVAVGVDGNYTKVYRHEQIPFLDVNQDDYWLVDSTVTLEPIPTYNVTPQDDTQAVNTMQPTTNNPLSDATITPASPRTLQTLTIEGKVPLENWTQLFSSFITMLKNNRLEIEIKLTAHSTAANPITDNSQTYASVKESAKQLGLDFTEK